MGRIKLILLLISFPALGQTDKGDGRQSIFIEGIPEFVSINVDHILLRFADDSDLAIRSGFMFNFTLWMGVPLELNYVIPVGTDRNHLEVGGIFAYTWDSKANPYEVFAGPRLGFRRQKNSYGVFYRFGIGYTFNKFVSNDESENSFKLKPLISIGYSF